MQQLSLAGRTTDLRALGAWSLVILSGVAIFAAWVWPSLPHSDMELAHNVEQRNRTGHESAEAVAATTTGYAVAGQTNSKSPGVTQAWLLSFEGTATRPRIDRAYHSGFGSIARAIATTSDGGLLLAGEVEGRKDRFQPWVLSLSPSGEPRWERVLGRPGLNGLTSAAALSDGSAIVAGAQDEAGWLVRISDSGATLWFHRLPELEDVTALVALPDKGFAIAGISETSTTGLGTSHLITFDEQQQPRWKWQLAPDDRGELRSLAALPDGGLVAAGRVQAPGSDSWGLWVVRWDAKGTILWEHRPQDATVEAGFAVVALADGGVAVAGDSLKGLNDRDARVWRFGPGGELLWRKSYGGDAQDLTRGITRLPSGEFIVVGSTMSGGATKTELLILKLSQRGELIEQKLFGGQ